MDETKLFELEKTPNLDDADIIDAEFKPMPVKEEKPAKSLDGWKESHRHIFKDDKGREVGMSVSYYRIGE